MMQLNNEPFRSEPFALTSPYRPVGMQFGTDGKEKEPLGVVTEAAYNFDQTNSGDVIGSNYYFNLSGDSAFDRSGLIYILQNTNALVIHPQESWTEPIDTYHEKDITYSYGIVEVSLNIMDRWEFHNPFKGVKFKFKFKKRTSVYKTVENTEDPFEMELISSDVEDDEFEFQLPDDFDQGKYRFNSNDLTISEKVDRGFAYPGKTGGKFHDQTDKYGFDHIFEERFYTLADSGSGFMYRNSLDRIERTEIEYLLDINEVTQTVTPAAFYNQE
ncbi:hypothetical protein UFOVP510_44 [uncultured Caudovirales phage]|uniref:Uncharacterized protein n=1 Tax=uncultured Caudovirales phage TaxID=2100421 RepID=A0A6J5MR99_9CAUD|nr:hypothetical protein UFOVP510_44 [uncultured Caudovirales phage]